MTNTTSIVDLKSQGSRCNDKCELTQPRNLLVPDPHRPLFLKLCEHVATALLRKYHAYTQGIWPHRNNDFTGASSSGASPEAPRDLQDEHFPN